MYQSLTTLSIPFIFSSFLISVTSFDAFFTLSLISPEKGSVFISGEKVNDFLK